MSSSLKSCIYRACALMLAVVTGCGKDAPPLAPQNNAQAAPSAMQGKPPRQDWESRAHARLFKAGYPFKNPKGFEPYTVGEVKATFSDALRAFQTFYKLPVTGELDVATAALLQKSRCGTPDTAHLKRDNAQRKWPKKDFTYKHIEFAKQPSKDEVRKAITTAYKVWADSAPLSFKEVPEAEPADIHIRFTSLDHQDGFSFDGKDGDLAHAFFPPPGGGRLAGHMHFDNDESWYFDPLADYDLLSVAIHEIGHSMGLDHNDDDSSVMYAYYGRRRSLTPNDKAAIIALYGNK